MWLSCALLLFMVLFVAISASIQRSGLFGGNTGAIVALCTALLCMLGLHQGFVSPANGKAAVADREGHGFDFLLLPYAALAVAILSVLLLQFVRKALCQWERPSVGEARLPRNPPSSTLKDHGSGSDADCLRRTGFEAPRPLGHGSATLPGQEREKSRNHSIAKEIRK
ncbi:MAG: hypothetical protein JW993_07610 [Sedimentisphaerales bacterium]|nr:hypothetical protein [Sedimentisphaerales bacterium]